MSNINMEFSFEIVYNTLSRYYSLGTRFKNIALAIVAPQMNKWGTSGSNAEQRHKLVMVDI